MSTPHGEGVGPVNDSLVALMVILAVAMVATPLAVNLVLDLFLDDVENGPWMSAALIAQQGVMLALTLWRLKRSGVSWSSLRPYIEQVGQAGIALYWGAGLLFLNGALAQLSALMVHWLLGAEALEALLEGERAVVARLLDPGMGTFLFGLTVFTAVGIAPLVEELFFRGYAYRVLKHHTRGHAAWLSALLFAGVHLYVINFVPVFVLGILLVRLYERTGAIAVPILAHATFNALVAIVTFTAGAIEL